MFLFPKSGITTEKLLTSRLSLTFISPKACLACISSNELTHYNQVQVSQSSLGDDKPEQGLSAMQLLPSHQFLQPISQTKVQSTSIPLMDEL